MATQSTKASSGRNQANLRVLRRKKSAGRSGVAPPRNLDEQSQDGNGRRVSIPPPLRAFLGSERDAVVQVQSLLVCIGQAIKFEHPATGPYYPDIVGLAADILRRRVVNMDDLLLDGLLPAGFDQSVRGD